MRVTNGTPAAPVLGVAVDLAVDSAYGSISPARVVTDRDGKATATFRHGTVAGTATIAATVLEGVGVPLTRGVEQQIDHARANKIVGIRYDREVAVGGTTEIAVRMEDQCGNTVDNRREAETVLFAVSPPGHRALQGSLSRHLRLPAHACIYLSRNVRSSSGGMSSFNLCIHG